MNCQSSISKFKVRNKIIYARINWKENETDLFHIEIFEGGNVWVGRFSNEFANRYMLNIDESEEEYRTNAKKALTARDSSFIYDFARVSGDTGSATFTWKRKYENSSAIVAHGSVPVHQAQTERCIDSIIDFLLQENEDLRRLVDYNIKKNEELSKDLQDTKNKLAQFIDIKTNLESNLYARFMVLLNAKKKRIDLLEKKIQNCNTSEMETELD